MLAPKKMTQSMSWVMLVFNVPFRGRENIWILDSLCDWGFPPSIGPVCSRAMMASDSPLCVRAITRLCDPFCVWVIFVLIALLRVRGVIATYDPLCIRASGTSHASSRSESRDLSIPDRSTLGSKLAGRGRLNESRSHY
jgi:hypothetical protein